MQRVIDNFLPLYTICAVVTFGHAWQMSAPLFAHREPADALFLTAFAAGAVAAGWPAYLSAHLWGWLLWLVWWLA